MLNIKIICYASPQTFSLGYFVEEESELSCLLVEAVILLEDHRLDHFTQMIDAMIVEKEDIMLVIASVLANGTIVYFTFIITIF